MNQISKTVDSWVSEEEIPVSPALKIIRESDPWYGMTEEEVDDAKEFIRCYINQEFEILLQIPAEPLHNDFWSPTHQDFQESAFNTHDFQKGQRPFNKYGYRIKRILEQVKDLALLHSCISQQEGRSNVQRRYENLVDDEFRGRLLYYVSKYKFSEDEESRFRLKMKIRELNRRILACKMIWERYSPWEAWGGPIQDRDHAARQHTKTR